MMQESPTRVRELWPLLVVQDMQRSLMFYRDLLGFELLDQAENDGQVFWCRLRCGGATLMLQQAEAEDGSADGRGKGVTFYFVCNDADAMYVDLSTRGLELQLPTVACYGMKQLPVPEPDGYILCFESPCEMQVPS